MNAKVRWNNLMKKANAADCGGSKGFDRPYLAMESAGENALDSGHAWGTKEWFVCALGSISSTSWFCENADCREWFKRNGYEW
jgi:hypothetical protein